MATGCRVVLVLVLLLAASRVEGRHGVYPSPHGHTEFSDGSECAWFEMAQSPTMTNLAMGCTCKNEAGTTQAYTCQYKGEPDSCPPWKEDSMAFLRGLVDQLVDSYDNGCDEAAEKVERSGCVLKKEDVTKPALPCKDVRSHNTPHEL